MLIFQEAGSPALVNGDGDSNFKFVYHLNDDNTKSLFCLSGFRVYIQLREDN